MISYMLDTDICIYLIKEKDPTLKLRLYEKGIGFIALSVITLAELSYGTGKSSLNEQNKLALALFLAPFEILPFSADAALTYGQVRANLGQRGKIIGAYNMLIASHALSEGFTVVTNNIAEFSRIEGLDVENWINSN
jgi:tRNA(fMet)-specific endonuclease VapC